MKHDILKTIQFYLNYVGCKVWLYTSIRLFKTCFTLTMWDVKKIVAENVWKQEPGFTLTMWDVKFYKWERFNDIFTVLP